MMPIDPRRGGVTPNSQEPKFGSPDTVYHVVKAEMLVVDCTDKNGVRAPVTYIKIGDDLYLPPDSAVWTARLTRVAPARAKKILELTPKPPTTGGVTTEDSVDVLDDKE